MHPAFVFHEDHRVQHPDRSGCGLPFKLCQNTAIKARLSGSQNNHINRSMFNHLSLPPLRLQHSRLVS